jgi:hypothetical protein
MSRTDDYGLTDSDRERNDRSGSVFDRATELPSRLGLSRDAARAEMERFSGIAEYETRKIFGQRSVLNQPVDVGVPKKGKRKKSDHTEPRADRLNQRERTDSGNESAQGPKHAISAQAQHGSLQTELDLHD